MSMGVKSMSVWLQSPCSSHNIKQNKMPLGNPCMMLWEGRPVIGLQSFCSLWQGHSYAFRHSIHLNTLYWCYSHKEPSDFNTAAPVTTIWLQEFWVFSVHETINRASSICLISMLSFNYWRSLGAWLPLALTRTSLCLFKKGMGSPQLFH